MIINIKYKTNNIVVGWKTHKFTTGAFTDDCGARENYNNNNSHRPAATIVSNFFDSGRARPCAYSVFDVFTLYSDNRRVPDAISCFLFCAGTSYTRTCARTAPAVRDSRRRHASAFASTPDVATQKCLCVRHNAIYYLLLLSFDVYTCLVRDDVYVTYTLQYYDCDVITGVK